MKKTKAEILALLGESITLPAILWVFGVTLIVKDKEHLIPGMYIALACAAFSMFLFLFVLKRPRSVVFLAVLSGALFAAVLTLHLLIYEGNAGFGYVLSSLLISATAVFSPLNYCLTKQTLLRHIGLLDVSVMALIWLFLNLSVIKIETLSVVLMIAVPVTDMAGTAALRMDEGGMNEGAGKAFLLAGAGAAVAAGIIFLLSKLLARSGNVTEAVFTGIRNFFAWIWSGIEAFFGWLSRFFVMPEAEEINLLPETGMTGAEEAALEEIRIDPLIPAVIAGAVIAAILILVIYKLRKLKLSVSMGKASENVVISKTRRKAGFFREKWRVLLKKLKFRKDAFVYRNTPPGVLVYMEKKAVKKKTPRRSGESIREFISRIAPGENFKKLADDLERRYYGGEKFTLSSGDCRTLRKAIAKGDGSF